MGLGLAAITGVFGYIAYMRMKYESLGYYAAVQEDGREVFTKKKSKWDWDKFYKKKNVFRTFHYFIVLLKFR